MSIHRWLRKVFLGLLCITLTACSAAASPTPTLGRLRGTRTFSPRSTGTATVLPSLTPTPAPTLTATPAPTITPFPSGTPPSQPCNAAAFGATITIPDGTRMRPGYAFTKTWLLKNIGSCTWTARYAVVFVSGDRLGDVTAVSLPVEVRPNQTVTVSVPMLAPQAGGTYTGYWMLRSGGNEFFGLGLTRDQPFWVKIVVLNPVTPRPTFPFPVFPTRTPTP